MAPLSPVRTAVIPAAGLGTRLLPATKAIPKELLPIGAVPAMQFILEECHASGIHRLVVVVSEHKDNLVRYLTPDPALLTLRKEGPNRNLQRLEELLSDLEIHFVTQDEPRGLGHAVLMARDEVEEASFAVLLPDDLYPGEEDGIVELERFGDGGVALGLIEVAPNEVMRYGIVAGSRNGDDVAVTDVIEKPPVERAPSTLAIIGRYILPAAIFDVLDDQRAGAGGEIQLTDAIRTLIARGVPARGRVLGGLRLDIGDLGGYLMAEKNWLAQPRGQGAGEPGEQAPTGTSPR